MNKIYANPSSLASSFELSLYIRSYGLTGPDSGNNSDAKYCIIDFNEKTYSWSNFAPEGAEKLNIYDFISRIYCWRRDRIKNIKKQHKS